MPITIESRENGHILYSKITDPLILSELEPRYRDEQDYREQNNYTMHTLLDVTELKHFPPSVLGVARRSPTLTHPRRGHLALVGAASFLEALMGALQRITRSSEVRFFKTEEAAMAYLKQVIADEAKNQPVEEIPAARPSRPT